MKYFSAYYTCADTCGNTWIDDAKSISYYAAKSIKDVIEKEQIKVSSYTLNKVNKYNNPIVIDSMRTPAGKGYGQWEDNPEFNFEKDLPNIIAVSSGGFGKTHISEIKIDFI